MAITKEQANKIMQMRRQRLRPLGICKQFDKYYRPGLNELTVTRVDFLTVCMSSYECSAMISEAKPNSYNDIPGYEQEWALKFCI